LFFEKKKNRKRKNMSELRISGGPIDALNDLLIYIRQRLAPPLPPPIATSVEVLSDYELLISTTNLPNEIKDPNQIEKWVLDKKIEILQLVKLILGITGEKFCEKNFNGRSIWLLDGESMSTYLQFIYQNPTDVKSGIRGLRISWSEGILQEKAERYVSQLKQIFGINSRR